LISPAEVLPVLPLQISTQCISSHRFIPFDRKMIFQDLTLFFSPYSIALYCLYRSRLRHQQQREAYLSGCRS